MVSSCRTVFGKAPSEVWGNGRKRGLEASLVEVEFDFVDGVGVLVLVSVVGGVLFEGVRKRRAKGTKALSFEGGDFDVLVIVVVDEFEEEGAFIVDFEELEGDVFARWRRTWRASKKAVRING